MGIILEPPGLTRWPVLADSLFFRLNWAWGVANYNQTEDEEILNSCRELVMMAESMSEWAARHWPGLDTSPILEYSVLLQSLFQGRKSTAVRREWLEQLRDRAHQSARAIQPISLTPSYFDDFPDRTITTGQTFPNRSMPTAPQAPIDADDIDRAPEPTPRSSVPPPEALTKGANGPPPRPPVLSARRAAEIPDRLIDLNQAAALVNRTPDGLKHYRNKGMPEPQVRGRKGQPNQYLLSEMRPWLETHFHPIPDELIRMLLAHHRP